ncbi:MAG: hypothetical protein FJ088_07715 [Deltaproteobacteria bacterium]|nr:hypothetical protein [Deltaproteobacteria bacterium]
MKTIKRYPNRKLYDTTESRYITLDEIASLIREGEEVRVVDSRNGDDITAITLAQILIDRERLREGGIDLGILKNVIRTGGDFLAKKLSNPVTSFREEAEKKVSRIMKGSGIEEIKGFLEHTIKGYEDFQKRIDDRILLILDTVKQIPKMREEIDRLKKEIEEIRKRPNRRR